MPANTYTTYSSVSNREDLSDKIFSVGASDTPFISSIGRTKATAINHEWTTDAIRSANASNASIEGADAVYVAKNPTTRLGNRTQILGDRFSISATQDAVSVAGKKDIARLKVKGMLEVAKDIEAAALSNGASLVGSPTVARTMRGLKGFLATNFFGGAGSAAPVIATNTAPIVGTARAYTEALLTSAYTAAYNAGGEPTQIHMSPNSKNLQNAFTGNAVRQQPVTGAGDQTKLQATYAIYAGSFGNLEIVPNRVMGQIGDTAVYVVDPSNFKLAELRGFATTELAQTGDARNFQIIWEGTLEAGAESTSAQVRDLLT